MSCFRYERDADGVVTLTFDMPGRSQNVWSQASIDDLSAVVERLAGDAEAKGAILTSAKKDFVAGADLEELKSICFGPRDAADLNARCGALSVVLRRMETCGKPVVAAINGAALGGGLELCLAAHRRIVADDPRIKLGLPEATLGLLPGGGGTQRLARLIGVTASMPLLMEGKQLRPDAAKKAGFVDEIVPAAELMAAARAWLLGKPVSTQPWDAKGYKVPGGGVDDGTVLQTFMVANAMLLAKTQGNYPAGRAILSCLYEGLAVDIDAGLLVEKRYFVQLLLGPVAGAMIRTLFLSMQEANKLARRPAGVPRRKPARIGILGAGLMGAGVAFVAAGLGIEVVILDRSREAAEAAWTYATQRLDKQISRGQSTPAQKEALLGRIHPTADYADLAGCDAVVEAVFEDRAVKAQVTAAADAVLGPEAIFGSNTSTLPITGLAAASSRPDRFIGLHFFSPVERMPLVEVIRGEATSEETLAFALDLVQALGKTPIVVRDSRGFYTSRVFGTYITEGMAMLAEGIAPTLIEAAGRRSGMPMPPLALADEVGLGLMAQVGRQTRADLGDAAPHNPSTVVLEALVDGQGRTGKRSGQGFYDYGMDGGKRLWSGLGAQWPARADQPTVEALVTRFLYTQALEAARCVEAGVIEDPGEADVGAILGWGFAPYTGGPLSFIDGVGLPAFVAQADALADAVGERFRPPALLRRFAEEGRGFYPR